MISEHDSNIIPETSTYEEVKEDSSSTSVDHSLQENVIQEEEEEANVPSSEEQSMNTEEVDIPSKSDTENPVLDQSVIIEGKRSRKPTARLEISEPSPAKKEIIIPNGHGKPLGEIEYIKYQISHASTDALVRMHTVCFGRRGSKTTIRKHLRAFHGFEFEVDSDEYKKHFSHLIKFKKDELRTVSHILGLSGSGRNTVHAERIFNFLMKPVDEGKKIPGKKSAARNMKKRSTNSKESVDTDQETSTQSGKVEEGSDYNFKPGKRASDHENSSNPKRKKGVSKSKENEQSSEEVIQ